LLKIAQAKLFLYHKILAQPRHPAFFFVVFHLQVMIILNCIFYQLRKKRGIFIRLRFSDEGFCRPVQKSRSSSDTFKEVSVKHVITIISGCLYHAFLTIFADHKKKVRQKSGLTDPTAYSS
jgi:hypothetical protein